MHRRDVPEIDVLRAARAFHEHGGQTAEASLIQWPQKLVEARMEQLVKRGLLEYGVSLRTAWLTDKGRERLQELEAVLFDQSLKGSL